MNLTELSKVVHTANSIWWTDIQNGQPIQRNKGELLALIHSELSECADGEAGRLMDDKLPNREMAEVETADYLIRVLDYSAGFGYDLNNMAVRFGIIEFHNLDFYDRIRFKTLFNLESGARNRGIEFMHSKVSRILELERKNSEKMTIESALVVCVVMARVWADIKGYDLYGAYTEKMAYNANRQDHKHEARRIAGGKKF